MNLTIDRKRWLRGEGGAASFLLRERDMKMCCLGFLCLAGGVSQADILNKHTPSQARAELPEQLKGLLLDRVTGGSNQYTAELMLTNDERCYDSDTEREANITRLFLKKNVIVEFVG